MDRAEKLLCFWFADSPAPQASLEPHMRRWFRRSPSFDRRVRDRHGGEVDRALRGEFAAWAASARGRLALILLLDQMTRNSFRGTAQAFAGDATAVALSREGIRLGQDLELAPVEQLFFYLPLFHSECQTDQQLSVACFERLANEAPICQLAIFTTWAAHARGQCGLIRRFGRNPARNRTLGRRTTPREWLFLTRSAIHAAAVRLRRLARRA